MGGSCFTIGKNCKKNIDPESKKKSKELVDQLKNKAQDQEKDPVKEISKNPQDKTKPSNKLNETKPENDIDIPAKDILNFDVSNKLGLPRTSISRINGLLQEYASGDWDAETLFKDDIFLTHLSSASAEKDKSDLGKQYGKSADKLASKAWKELPEDKKREASLDQRPEVLKEIIKKTKSEAAKKIAEEMQIYHEKEEEKEREKERAYLKNKSKKPIDLDESGSLEDF